MDADKSESVGTSGLRRWRWRLAFALTLVVATVPAYIMVRNGGLSSDDLVHRSELAAVVAIGHMPEHMTYPDYPIEDGPLWWIDDHRGLIIRPEHETGYVEDGYYVDTVNHRYTYAKMMARLDGFSPRDSLFNYTYPVFLDKPLLGQVQGPLNFSPGEFGASADGKMGFVCGTDFQSMGGTERGRVGVFELTHADRVQWVAAPLDEDCCWLDNGRTAIGMYKHWSGLIHYELFTRGRASITVKDQPVPPVFPKGCSAKLAGVTSAGKVVAIEPQTGAEVTGLKVYQFSVDPNARPGDTRCDAVTAPLSGTLQQGFEYKVSRDGSHIAWLLSYPRGTGVPFFDWIYAKLGKRLRAWQGIYVTDLDGRNPRLLGEMPVQFYGELDHLDWLPSGKSVSYYYHHAVYTIPVDGSRANKD